MALTSTIYSFTIELSDVDRGVYETFDLRAALHPSESPQYFVTRILAYCLEYQEGLAFAAGGVSDAEEPAILARDLTGTLVTWIEVGFPDADRLHRASKAAQHVAVYTHRDPRTLLAQLRERRIHRAADIPIYSFGRDFVETVAQTLERRMQWTLSITERHLYLDINGHSFETIIEHHPL